MKKTIWKYELSLEDFETILVPKDSTILSVQMQRGNPCIWFLVNPENEKEERSFEFFGTGSEIHCDMGMSRNYIGTIQLNNEVLVFHLFERSN